MYIRGTLNELPNEIPFKASSKNEIRVNKQLKLFDRYKTYFTKVLDIYRRASFRELSG